MGLFDIFKKKQAAEPAQTTNDILLAMPLFCNNDRYQLPAVINDLKAIWDLDTANFEGDDDTAVFELNGEKIALAFIPAPIPGDDVPQTAAYAYGWPNAMVDLENCTGHAILSIMSGNGKPVERFALMSKVLCSIFRTTEAVGVLKAEQSLLLPRDQYLDAVEELQAGGTPVNLWIYIGLRPGENSNSVYTYGLKAFHKKDIEIVNSAMTVEALYNFLYNIVSYVIGHDVSLNHGETIGVSAEQKIAITHSKGVHVDAETIKLEI